MKIDLARISGRPAAFCRRFLGPNGDLMVVSFFLSAILLTVIHRQVVSLRHDRTYLVPVTVKSQNEKMAVASYEPAAVEVTLRGSLDDISALDPSRLSVEAVSLDQKEGTESETLKLSPKHVIGAGKLRILSVSPQFVDVRYDYMVNWSAVGRIATPKLEGVPVQGSASVEMPTNLTLKVHGSESKINAFREKKILFPTSPINVEGKTESFDALVAIMIPLDSGIIKVEPAMISVHVDVKTVAAAGVEDDTAPLERVADQTAVPPPAPAAASGEPPAAGLPPEAAAAPSDGGEAGGEAPGEAGEDGLGEAGEDGLGEAGEDGGVGGVPVEESLPPPVEMTVGDLPAGE